MHSRTFLGVVAIFSEMLFDPEFVSPSHDSLKDPEEARTDPTPRSADRSDGSGVSSTCARRLPGVDAATSAATSTARLWSGCFSGDGATSGSGANRSGLPSGVPSGPIGGRPAGRPVQTDTAARHTPETAAHTHAAHRHPPPLAGGHRAGGGALFFGYFVGIFAP
eukprot:667793-Prorocentrum_minimum.AAC.2